MFTAAQQWVYSNVRVAFFYIMYNDDFLDKLVFW